MARKACYLALGVRLDGQRDVLGMWFQDTEGAKFWMHVLGEIKRRGVRDILICCVDGLDRLSRSDRGDLPADDRPNLRGAPDPPIPALRPAARAREGRPRSETDLHRDRSRRRVAALEAFDAKWGERFPPVVQAWQDAWEHFTPFLAFTDEVRRVIYTTNAIEALNRQLRKAIKTKGHFPSEDAARKLLYLAIQNATPQWTRTRAWTKALLAFKIEFGDRLPDAT